MAELRGARAGIGLAFFVTGLLSATWASRIPAVQDRLDLSPGGLAVVVLAIEAGALIGLPLGAAVVTHRGSRTGLHCGLAVYAPGLVLAAAAPDLGRLVPAAAIWAAANSLLDVALNAQGVELGRRSGRPVLSTLHAGQGFGLLVGAAAGTAAAAAGVPLPLHATVVAAAGLLLGVGGASRAVREPPDGDGPVLARPDRSLLVLGSVAFCAFLVDGTATNWIAVHLRSVHGAGQGLAAAAYLVFTAALVAGRLPADRLVVRWTRLRMVQACALGITVGGTVVVLAPDVAAAVVGWTVVGLALAPLAPTVLGAAPGIGNLPTATAMAGVTTVGYLGSFTGPPLVGLLAGGVGLAAALTVLVAAGVVTALLAPRVLARR